MRDTLKDNSPVGGLLLFSANSENKMNDKEECVEDPNVNLGTSGNERKGTEQSLFDGMSIEDKALAKFLLQSKD